jgi:hypothetical protein
MGLFGNKQHDDTGKDGASNDTQLFFDEYFREELRNRARWYFENIINENYLRPTLIRPLQRSTKTSKPKSPSSSKRA